MSPLFGRDAEGGRTLPHPSTVLRKNIRMKGYHKSTVAKYPRIK